MDNRSKSKSLILLKAVSKNPEKILFSGRYKNHLILGDEVGSFLEEIMRNRIKKIIHKAKNIR